MTTEETAWLAGLLEGEGCFAVTSKSRARPDVRVELKMTDRDVVLRAAALMGFGPSRLRMNVSPYPRHKDTHVVSARAEDAVRVMLAVRPYMGARRGARIDECLAARPDLTREENA